MKFSESVEWVFGAAAIFVASAYFWIADGMEVIEFNSVEYASATDAEPGEWVSVVLPVKKKRNCTLKRSGGPLVYQQDYVEPKSPPWERDGPLLQPIDDWQDGRIRFRVPIDAKTGTASVVFLTEFQCILRTVSHRSPAIPFEVKEKPPTP